MRAPFADADLEVLERVVRVNFLGTMAITWFAVPHIKQTRGSLVAISSLTGKCGTPSYAAYGASKFAVQGLYEALRRELAPDGVHVGIVSPGFVDTPLREQCAGAGRPTVGEAAAAAVPRLAGRGMREADRGTDRAPPRRGAVARVCAAADRSGPAFRRSAWRCVPGPQVQAPRPGTALRRQRRFLALLPILGCSAT